jgi:hypothetical protein
MYPRERLLATEQAAVAQVFEGAGLDLQACNQVKMLTCSAEID